MHGPRPANAHVRARMERQRRIGTSPEMDVRRRLHGAGLRYRVGLRIPGLPRRTIDVAFTRARVAVFIDGCFWHRCPVHSIPPRNNAAWWAAKLATNVARDRDTALHLEQLGWVVLRFWEHENPDAVTDTVAAAVRSRQ